MLEKIHSEGCFHCVCEMHAGLTLFLQMEINVFVDAFACFRRKLVSKYKVLTNDNNRGYILCLFWDLSQSSKNILLLTIFQFCTC